MVLPLSKDVSGKGVNVDQGSLNIKEVIDLLNGDAWVRLVASGAEGTWSLRHLHAVIGSQPPAWPDHDWIYGDIALLRAKLSIDRLKDALVAEDCRRFSVGSIEVEVPEVGPQVGWRRRPSFEQHDRERLQKPTWDLRVSAAQTSQHQLNRSGYLVGRSCPSFPDLQYAFRAFFEGDFSLNGGMSLPSELMVIRVINDEGWIGPIHVTPTHIDVQVDGRDLLGASLELYSTDQRTTTDLNSPNTVTFELPGGLPDTNVWLWLKKDGRWLDYRALYRPWATPDQLEAAGVKIDLPVDPLSTIEALVSGGEGPQVEFKRSLPETKSKDRNPYKTIAAFATMEGGWIVFGVDRDELTVVGLEVDDINGERDRLANLIRARVNPTPPFEATPYVIDGKQIMVLRVDSGVSPPYGIAVDPDAKDRPEYFVRRGASTYPAWPADLREAVMSRQPPAGFPNGMGGLGGAFPG
ncbi:hypothetical protein GHK86_00685 [Acidimicrobiaceae bacterium USS-CC1]|uniref:Schlafen AlbA-2 domain-containing protein n=1 Tax=Acidiferrimicrobium australe TaxID=2664430 RepID=A0ABW9QNL7_9ACTN|nr:hypothetical protein [Acidiferrimicrobium australe]